MTRRSIDCRLLENAKQSRAVPGSISAVRVAEAGVQSLIFHTQSMPELWLRLGSYKVARYRASPVHGGISGSTCVGGTGVLSAHVAA